MAVAGVGGSTGGTLTDGVLTDGTVTGGGSVLNAPVGRSVVEGARLGETLAPAGAVAPTAAPVRTPSMSQSGSDLGPTTRLTDRRRNGVMTSRSSRTVSRSGVCAAALWSRGMCWTARLGL